MTRYDQDTLGYEPKSMTSFNESWIRWFAIVLSKLFRYRLGTLVASKGIPFPAPASNGTIIIQCIGIILSAEDYLWSCYRLINQFPSCPLNRILMLFSEYAFCVRVFSTFGGFPKRSLNRRRNGRWQLNPLALIHSTP